MGRKVRFVSYSKSEFNAARAFLSYLSEVAFVVPTLENKSGFHFWYEEWEQMKLLCCVEQGISSADRSCSFPQYLRSGQHSNVPTKFLPSNLLILDCLLCVELSNCVSGRCQLCDVHNLFRTPTRRREQKNNLC